MHLLISLLFAFCASPAHELRPGDGLRVVATIPDLADIAGEIGGERIERMTTLAKGTMNIHAVPLRPSSLVAVNKADLFLQMGLSMEHAYVPGLLMRGRNPRVQPGAPGFVNCSEGWEALEIPEMLDRSQGTDLHPLGNPHFNLDPRGGRHIAARILEGFVRVDPDNRAYYEERHADYVRRLDEAAARWEALRPVIEGAHVVTYHRDFTYFAAYYRISFETIEPKPGVPPTPRDMAGLVARMKDQGLRIVLTAHWSNNKSVRFVAEKAGAKVVEIPVMVGGVKGADTWIGMQDILHERVAAALADSNGDDE